MTTAALVVDPCLQVGTKGWSGRTKGLVEKLRPALAASKDKAKATLGSDYVICAFPALIDAEARLEDVYRAARAAKGDDVKTQQVEWIKHFGADCGLPSDQIQGVAGCVRSAMEKRIRELQAQQ
jgi:uncharacterized protein